MSVSEMGLGCWQLGNPIWGEMEAKEAHQIVDQALAEGCTFFDTAPGYADGRSETLLGQAVKKVRPEVRLCTKFGHGGEEPNFEAKAVEPALQASLDRLQADYIDFYLLHNPPTELLMDGDSPLFAELERLKAKGKLRAYGVSLDSLHELELVMEKTCCEVVEILFNVFHQEPLAAFAKARAKGIGLIVKVPLDSGWLSGKYRGGHRFDGIRDRWTPDLIRRRGDLVEQFAKLVPSGMSLSHAALQYILAQAEVSTIIPGAKSVAQARDNFAAASGALSVETVRAIHSFWEREISPDPLPW